MSDSQDVYCPCTSVFPVFFLDVSAMALSFVEPFEGIEEGESKHGTGQCKIIS